MEYKKICWAKAFKSCKIAYEACDNVDEIRKNLYEMCSNVYERDGAFCLNGFEAYKGVYKGVYEACVDIYKKNSVLCSKQFEAYKGIYEACENVSEVRDSLLCHFCPFLLNCGLYITAALLIYFLFCLLSPTLVRFFASEEEKQKIREIKLPTRSVEEVDMDSKTDIGF